MTPLAELVTGQMRKRGWSPQQVEERGVSHATLFRYMRATPLRQPPRPATLAALANALDLPLGRVQQAAVRSVGYVYEEELPDGATALIASLEALGPDARSAEAARLIAVLRDYLPDEGDLV